MPLESNAPATLSDPAVSAERAHHPYSPSSLQNLEACPDYRSRSSTHARTIAGTLGHKMVETGEDDNALGDEDALAAAECIDFVETRKRLMEEEAAAALANASQSGAVPVASLFQITELKEAYLPVDEIQFSDCKCTTAGFADRILVNHNRTRAELLDWKFGFWQVEAPETNLQGIGYALGVFRMFPTVQSVIVFFLQPRLNSTQQATFTRAQIPEIYLRVQAVVARARLARLAGTFETAKPYVPVCNFCDNLGRCPRGLEFALKVAHKFVPLEFPAEITPTMVMDKANTAKAMRLSAVMKVWSDAFKRQVTDRVLRQEMDMPEGYRLETRNGNREIADLGKFKAATLQFLTEAQYETCLSASFGPLETMIADAAPRGSKKTQVEAFQKSLEASGAVSRGSPFSFLKVISSKDKTDSPATNG